MSIETQAQVVDFPAQSAARDRLLVVIPAHNEEATVGKVVRCAKQGLTADVVVVDDASVDRTAEIARDAGALVVPLAARLGAWRATQAGMRYALEEEYRWVVTMDADDQHVAEHILDLIQPIRDEQADVVIGANPTRWTKKKQFCQWFLSQCADIRVDDLTSGFRAYNQAAVELLSKPPVTQLDYQDVGVLLELMTGGMRIKEVEVPMRARQHGRSRVFQSWGLVFYYVVHSVILGLSKRRSYKLREQNDPDR